MRDCLVFFYGFCLEVVILLIVYAGDAQSVILIRLRVLPSGVFVEAHSFRFYTNASRHLNLLLNVRDVLNYLLVIA